MKIGQKVFVEPRNNAARYSKEIKESRISKIGRKYFELEDDRFGRFYIDSMMQDAGNYTSNYKAYLSLQEIEDNNEANIIYEKLKSCFSGWKTTIPLDKLKKIKEILDS